MVRLDLCVDYNGGGCQSVVRRDVGGGVRVFGSEETQRVGGGWVQIYGPDGAQRG